MARLFRIVTTVFAVVLLLALSGNDPIQAQQQIGTTGLTGEMKSLTALVFASSEVVLLSVPATNNFVVTQVCHTIGTGSDHRLHNVGGGGNNSQVTLDNTDCKVFTPGILYVGGDDVMFRNNSGDTATRVLVNGILTKK